MILIKNPFGFNRNKKCYFSPDVLDASSAKTCSAAFFAFLADDFIHTECFAQRHTWYGPGPRDLLTLIPLSCRATFRTSHSTVTASHQHKPSVYFADEHGR